MDGLGEEVASVDVADGGPCLHGKEKEGSLKLAESSKLLESGEMAIPVESSFPESSFFLLADIMEGKNLNRGVSPSDMAEQPSPSPHYMDDGGNVIEELMVRNYDGSTFAIVGTSNNREKMQPRQGQWQHLYQIGGGSGTGHSRGNTLHRDNGQAIQDSWYSSSTDILVQRRSRNDRSEGTEELVNAEPKGVLSNTGSHASIRTKILLKSGFSEFFVKDSLKGKGIIFRGPAHDGMRPEGRDQNNGKAVDGEAVVGNDSMNMSVKAIVPGSRFSSLDCDGASFREWPGAGQPGGSNHDGLNLREWINSGRLKVSKFDCLNIFRQIVELVDCSHSEGDAMHDLRPSSFILLSSNQMKYLGSAVQREMPEGTVDQGIPYSGSRVIRRRQPEKAMLAPIGVFPKKQKFGENINHIQHWPQFTAKYTLKNGSANDVDGNRSNTQISRNKADEHNLNAKHGIQGKFTGCHLAIAGQQQFTSLNECLEEKWYSSPEELSEGIWTKSSNIYSLGVLLFELLGHFNNERAHAVAMSDLRHRILPSHFLSESPKEAGFCLWLLHPEPTSRPTTREILQSELINGLQGVSAEELSSSLDQDDTESALLLHFLVSLKEHKQQQASKLVEDVRCIDSDIEEIEKRNYSRKPFVHDCPETNFLNCLNSREDTFAHKEPSSSELLSLLSPSSKINEMRLMKNISQLENAYFSTRSKIQLTESDVNTRQDKELLRNRDNWHSEEDEEQQSSTDYRGSFFDGLCKYARYSKFEVRGLLRTGDFNNSANVICSLSFDRDGYYFAAAGVSKKIKIFEFSSLFNDMDIHYPVVEMVNGSKLSCVCWNSYIKNYLASTGYDGGVKLWDASTGQGIFQFHEHEKRAWSVDFSQVYPTKLASGSDDCSVKLWNINERKSLGTIRNIANVCCVQFSPYSTHLLAFGSADYRTYCYDLRNVRTPWCILAGHEKAVSYVKFLDPETLVTASTDNSLKIWDLNKTTFSGSSSIACSLTLGGHTNEKNFVGLSVANGYIACGSESNEVFSYYKSLPMPITSHKFGSIDPISGKETDDDNGQFVSSVCWRGKSDMIAAANSSGCIKVLQMV